MKTASPSLSVAVAVFAAAAFAFTAVAQAPQAEPSTPPAGGAAGAPMGGPRREMHFPPPKNLQVLPKNLTGEQVHKIMEGWAGALGTHCDNCHAASPNAAKGPGGRPRLDFALDTKPEKGTARMMVKMVRDINGNYVSKIKNSGVQVSCGTCHRGHLSPPAFKPPEEHREGPGAQPQGAPGATPTPAPAPAPGM
ncbi:MAG TPA: c-type cytochrome [Terracidiphilus sp.]|nr:c-type cytochrome [Terracidiphilus sp.]